MHRSGEHMRRFPLYLPPETVRALYNKCLSLSKRTLQRSFISVRVTMEGSIKKQRMSSMCGQHSFLAKTARRPWKQRPWHLRRINAGPEFGTSSKSPQIRRHPLPRSLGEQTITWNSDSSENELNSNPLYNWTTVFPQRGEKTLA